MYSSRGLAALLFLSILSSFAIHSPEGNPDAKRLYDDLISRYNKLVRPVINVSEALTVSIKLKLSQLIEVNLKNQIMTTNLWVEQYWNDYKLTWDPREYGGVDMLHVPSDHIWRPDIVLYNNADGNFEVTLETKAQLDNRGTIQWKPPAIYKSSCEIDVEYFPFDEQTCLMKFGSWTYDGFKFNHEYIPFDEQTRLMKFGSLTYDEFKVDLRHKDEVEGTNRVEIGIDLSEFYLSVEWDILDVPAIRNEKFYTCCEEPYIDITFNISMRRKTLFYTVNLIIPCMGISFLTVLVFYLPSDSGEKVSLSISILLSLTVFFLLLAEIIPPTSLVVPLLGKYLLFTMILVTLSICVTVVVLNVHFRTPSTHKMAPWVKRVFLHLLPRLLLMRRPAYPDDTPKVMVRTCNGTELQPQDYVGGGRCPSYDDLPHYSGCRIHGPKEEDRAATPLVEPHRRLHFCPDLQRAMESVHYIADHTRRYEDQMSVKEDWKYVAMVLDRLFLWIFSVAVLVGTCGIILHAPTLYDTREPIDMMMSEVAIATFHHHRGLT